MELEKLAELIKPYLELLPQNCRMIEIREETIVLLDGVVSVSAAKIDVNSIKRIIQKDGWQISTWVHQSNYPHGPDDIDEIEGASSTIPGVIAVEAVRTVFNVILRERNEQLTTEEFAKQLEMEDELDQSTIERMEDELDF